MGRAEHLEFKRKIVNAALTGRKKPQGFGGPAHKVGVVHGLVMSIQALLLEGALIPTFKK